MTAAANFCAAQGKSAAFSGRTGALVHYDCVPYTDANHAMAIEQNQSAVHAHVAQVQHVGVGVRIAAGADIGIARLAARSGERDVPTGGGRRTRQGRGALPRRALSDDRDRSDPCDQRDCPENDESLRENELHGTLVSRKQRLTARA